MNLVQVDPAFPQIQLHQGASGVLFPVVRNTAIRVQTLAIAAHHWKQSVAEIATDYDLTIDQVEAALAFYSVHQAEIDAAIAAEQDLETAHA